MYITWDRKQDLILSSIHRVFFNMLTPILFDIVTHFFVFSQFTKINPHEIFHIESFVKVNPHDIGEISRIDWFTKNSTSKVYGYMGGPGQKPSNKQPKFLNLLILVHLKNYFIEVLNKFLTYFKINGWKNFKLTTLMVFCLVLPCTNTTIQ